MNQKNYNRLMKSLSGDRPSEEDMWEIRNVLRRISDLKFRRCRVRFDRYDEGSNRLGIDIVSDCGIVLCLHTDIGPNDYEDWYIGDSSFTIWNGITLLVSDYGWLDSTLEYWKEYEKKEEEFWKMKRHYMENGDLGKYGKIRKKGDAE